MAGLDLAIHAAGAGRAVKSGARIALNLPARTATGVDDLIKSGHDSGQEALTPGALAAKTAATRDERGAMVKTILSRVFAAGLDLAIHAAGAGRVIKCGGQNGL